MYHDEPVAVPQHKRSIRESITLALCSIGLGAYCASFADHLLMQAVLMSLPPATLFFSQRRKKVAVPAVDAPRHTAVEYLSGVHTA
jgi:hypothetical protein